jgi:hypothetical protein
MDSEEKSATEVLAERADAWKMARSLLRGSDLPHYNANDVLTLADWLMAQYRPGDDE